MQENKAQIIKDRITMWDVLSRYGFEQKRRMRCPLHGGEDLNFAVKDHSFMCFSHCGGGDVITFVQKLFSLSFTETLKRIDDDFGLGLYRNKSLDELRQSHWKAESIRAERKRKEAEKAMAKVEYNMAIAEWDRMRLLKRKYAPKTKEEEWHPFFVEALQKMAYQEYALDLAEENLFLKAK
jgi:hypothetical protein